MLIKQNDILIIMPCQATVGGVGTISALLINDFCNIPNIKFMDATKLNNRVKNFLARCILMLKTLKYCFFHFGCKILVFSVGYKSFWEKSVLAIIVKLFGAQLYIVMIAGNFPDFYLPLPKKIKFIISNYVLNNVVIVAQSKTWGEFYSSIFSCSKIKLIRNGVDTNYFIPKHESNAKKHKIIKILFVGWVIAYKGIYDILIAMKILRNKISNYHIDLVGPFYENVEELKKIINDFDINDNITLHGSIQSRELLRSKYQAADIFILPSHFEGFPVALLEALSTGLPCIGTNVGGIPDILNDGECGILIEKKSPEQLANAILTMITNEELRIKMGLLSRDRAVNHFSLKESMESYRELLGIS